MNHINAEIELTSLCQLRCPFCRTGNALRKQYPQVPRGKITKETFLNIMNKVPNLGHISLYNWGEPFLHPDVVWFVQTVKQYGKTCELSSNMQIMTPEIAEGIVKAQLDILRVSCDGMTQETYSKYRQGGDIDKVIRNSKLLASTKEELKSRLPQVVFQFVVNRFNEHELPYFGNMAKQWGADQISPINICSMTPEGYFITPYFEPKNPRWKRYWGIGFLTNCRQPWEHITFDWNGDVYPCCNPSGIIDYKMGNINESSFEEIWNCPKYQYARRFCQTGIPENNGFNIMCHACYNKFPTEEMKNADMYRPCLHPFPTNGISISISEETKRIIDEYQSEIATNRAQQSYAPQENTSKTETKTKPAMLNLGCGHRHHPDWINIDVQSTGPGVRAHSLYAGIPFSDGAIDVVYHSHVLEHFPKRFTPIFLKDCHRVLKPGGIIRVAVPDLERIMRIYIDLLEKSLGGDIQAQQRYEWIMLELFDQTVRNQSGGDMLEYWKQQHIPAEDFVIERCGSEAKNVINSVKRSPSANVPSEDIFLQAIRNKDASLIQRIGMFRVSGEIHQWMYDRYSLTKLLQEAGFTDIKVCRADESAITNFNSYLLDIEPDGKVRKPDSLFMEAWK